MDNSKNSKKGYETEENIRGTYKDEQTKKDMGVVKKDHDKLDKERMHT